MSTAFPGAMLDQEAVDAIEDRMPNHEKDRHVLAAAVVGGIEVLVTPAGWGPKIYRNSAIYSEIAMEGTAKGVKRLGRRVAMRLADEPVPLFQAIAAQVAERRRVLNLSQRELADLCGTTQSAIARLERGQRPPRVDTLMRIAGALDCELVVELRSRTKRGGD